MYQKSNHKALENSEYCGSVCNYAEFKYLLNVGEIKLLEFKGFKFNWSQEPH